jgi:hypothetical protein
VFVRVSSACSSAVAWFISPAGLERHAAEFGRLSDLLRGSTTTVRNIRAALRRTATPVQRLCPSASVLRDFPSRRSACSPKSGETAQLIIGAAPRRRVLHFARR